MAVIVKFFASFRETTGKSQETVNGVKDLASLIDALVRRFGPRLSQDLYYSNTKELRKTVNIMVNGVGVKLPHDLGTRLKDGDIVAIFPPVSGG